MDALSDDFFIGDDFEAVLAISDCYDYGSYASEVVPKIITIAPFAL